MNQCFLLERLIALRLHSPKGAMETTDRTRKRRSDKREFVTSDIRQTRVCHSIHFRKIFVLRGSMQKNSSNHIFGNNPTTSPLSFLLVW